MDRDRLDSIADEIRSDFNSINEARDGAFNRSRQLIALCARSIRAIHREEWPQVEELLDEARSAAKQLKAGVKSYPNLYYAGYTQDALKEYVEANLVFNLICNRPITSPSELGVESNTWLNGMAEASTELRRSILDILRQGHSQEAERLLSIMDDIYLVLVTFDFSNAITGGLRRRTDTVRAVLERTRGDVTNSLRQAELQKALEAMENRLAVRSSESE